MTSAALCNTPNLAVPPTQNTALVLEFRCLYTHDLRRKSKRWQDGFLRFHTFNKRVMVYDVPRNFVGDSHWREDAAIQDGDELQLEKGVLIQVGEAVGRVEQDLTALFEKRKLAPIRNTDCDSPLRSSYTPVNGSTGPPSTQLRPKTLNALLGTPRGTHGRAILPSKTPHQERYLKEVQHDNQLPPIKRRRLDSQNAQRVGILGNVFIQSKQPASPNLKRTTAASSASSAARRCRDTEVIILESDEENLAPLTCFGADAKIPTLSQETNPSIDLPSSNTRPASKTTKAVLPPLIPPEASHRSVTKGKIVESLQGFESSNEVKPVNSLRFASSKPRKKLMYKDLLPQRPPSQSFLGVINPPVCLDGKSISERSEDDSQAYQLDDLSKFYKAQQARLEARLDIREQLQSSEASRGSLSTEIYSRDLLNHPDVEFLNEAQPAPPRPVRLYTDELGDRAKESISNANESSESRRPAKTRAPDFNEIHAPNNAIRKLAEPDIEASRLSQMDQILMTDKIRRSISASQDDPPIPDATEVTGLQGHASKQRAINISPPKKPKSSSDTPSLFETKQPGFPTHNGPPQLPALPRQRSPLKKSLSETNKTPNTLTPPAQGPPQRAVSDLTGLQRATTTRLSKNLPPHDKDLDLGPWSREAFDLFGWDRGKWKN